MKTVFGVRWSTLRVCFAALALVNITVSIFDAVYLREVGFLMGIAGWFSALTYAIYCWRAEDSADLYRGIAFKALDALREKSDVR